MYLLTRVEVLHVALQGEYMPKKKLTKAQVKRKLKTCSNAMYDMILDKMGHANSDVPMSLPKLMEMHKLLQNAVKRMK